MASKANPIPDTSNDHLELFPRPAHLSYPKPTAFLALFSFFGIWTTSPLLPPASLALAYSGISSYPLFGVIGYYAYRFVKPAKKWDACMKAYSSMLYSGYFKTQGVHIKTAPKKPKSSSLLKKDNKELLAFHPHGALSCGWTLANASNTLTSLNSNIVWLVAGSLFNIPMISDLLHWNSVGPISPKNMKGLMAAGKNIALLPGGFNEAALFSRNRHRIYILKRKGFVKYALQNGYNVRPVYCFGEEKTYYTVNFFERFRLWLADNNIPPVWFFSKFGILPFDDLNLMVVVGVGIQMPTIDNPTSEDVDSWHAKYVEGLKTVFEENKGLYADEGAVLEIY